MRGGGHNGPGLGVCDGGMVVDLSRMRGFRVDPRDGTVRVEGGCVWGDVDHATHPFGPQVRAVYRDNYARLARVKRQVDPGNLLRVNHNIKPV